MPDALPYPPDSPHDQELTPQPLSLHVLHGGEIRECSELEESDYNAPIITILGLTLEEEFGPSPLCIALDTLDKMVQIDDEMAEILDGVAADASNPEIVRRQTRYLVEGCLAAMEMDTYLEKNPTPRITGGIGRKEEIIKVLEASERKAEEAAKTASEYALTEANNIPREDIPLPSEMIVEDGTEADNGYVEFLERQLNSIPHNPKAADSGRFELRINT